MSILSIDVGIKNLAICIIDNDRTIIYWNVLETKDIPDMIKILDPIYLTHISEIKTVLIEKQPSFNPKMRNISSALYSYFIVRGQVDNNNLKNIIFYSPKLKLQLCENYTSADSLPNSKRYRAHKKMAIEQTQKFVSGENLIFFNSHKKKDDLADSYLQAVSYLSAKTSDNDKIVARKPTAKQINSKKLSRSNIKFLYNSAVNNFKNKPKHNDLELFLNVEGEGETLENFVHNFFVKNYPYVLDEYDLDELSKI